MSIRFDQESLDSALTNVVTEFQTLHRRANPGLKIVVVGDDLKMEGITRNKQIREFNEEDKTVEDILTQVVIRANPVAVARPSDKEQRLIWVIGPDPDNPDQEAILITTRSRAAEKYTLPEVFR
jgi:hypothetical protein